MKWNVNRHIFLFDFAWYFKLDIIRKEHKQNLLSMAEVICQRSPILLPAKPVNQNAYGTSMQTILFYENIVDI